MKKNNISLLITILLLFAAGEYASAQEKVMQVHRGGAVVYDVSTLAIDSMPLKNKTLQVYSRSSLAKTLDVLQIDSITFVDGNDRVYIGVVAFNDKISEFPISNDLNAAKAFISSKKNDVDRTALCYAVSKSVTLFNAPQLPAFDNIFVVSFTDGIDNGSSSLYVKDERQVVQGLVYDTAQVDLEKKTGLKAYTIGFGDQPLATSMQKLIAGGGEYKQSNSATLNSTFQEIANSVIASSKNVVLRTQDGLYTETYPKYVKLLLSTSAGNDEIVAKIVGYTLTIVIPGAYTTFDSPATGVVNSANNKIEIPLNRLKFVMNEEEYAPLIDVKMSYDNVTYYSDTEDTSAEEAIGKRIGVVLVLDCSTSLGTNFAPMQTAANNFINTLAKQVGASTDGGNTSAGSFTQTVKGVSFDMVAVAGGTFSMGSTTGESDERPVHQVTLSGYRIGKHEVTQRLWKAVMGSNPSYFTGDNLPVEKVSWYDANDFIEKLNQLTGKNYRLPTEAEWEYAARGGNKSKGYEYSGGSIGNVAWYSDNSNSCTHAVGTKSPNELGIYDMSGNVREWCSDWYGNYSATAQANPTGPATGPYRVSRGGGWSNSAQYCRVACRGGNTPGSSGINIGFRLLIP